MSYATNQARQIMGSLPPEVRRELGILSAESAKTMKFEPYFSRVRFSGTVAANTLTVASATRKPFAYKRGDSLVTEVAGYAAGTALDHHTNLRSPQQTNDNQKVVILGVSCQISEDSDAFLASLLFPKIIANVKSQGTTHELGPLTCIPGGGGLYGTGQTLLQLPDQTESYSRLGFGSISNGIPSRSNFARFQSPLIWDRPGQPNSFFSMEAILGETITQTLPATRAAVANAATIVGVGQYTQPSSNAAGTFLELNFWLHCFSVAPRDQNA